MKLENRKQDNNRSRVHFLESERIFLTPPLIEDFDKYYRWFHDKEFVNLVGSYFRPISYSKNREEFEKSILMCNGSKRVFLSIIIKENGEYIGNIGLDGIDNYERKCSFGIFIGEKRYWNKGYATETGKLMLKYAFEEIGLRRISSSTHSANKASIKVKEKLGFVKEGVFRQEYFFNGKYVDSIRYGMLREDYERAFNKRGSSRF